jgi:FtsP/CotA-like multicopper oxidase with cupredoxin domain
VYGGLAGFYLMADSEDTLGPDNAFGLPSGQYEIGLAIQDRTFNEDGSLFYNAQLEAAFKGNKVVVNGKVWPFLNVDQGKYRFRILNGSQSREYSMRLENITDPGNDPSFILVGTDVGLVSAPIDLGNSLSIQAPAERMDVVIDFAGYPAGTEIIMRNDEQTPPLLPNIMKFVVTNQAGYTGAIASTLRTVTPIPESSADVTRYFRLVREPNQLCKDGSGRLVNEWLIESLDGPNGNVIGKHWDDITEYPILGTREVWEFENPTNAMHPMHVHLVKFQIVSKELIGGGNIELEPWEENTWKDTVRVPPNSRVRIIMDFEDYLGRFPQHCHILDHEDHEMMRQFQTINDPLNCNLNGICEVGEDCISCADDCGQLSGAYCGNGLCETGDGENFDNCSLDCAGEPDVFACGDPADPAYVGCEDPRCTDGFFCRAESKVTSCSGDSLCEGQETAGNTAIDCEGQPEAVEANRCFDDLDNDADTLTDCADQEECNGAEGGVCDTGVPGICASGSQVCADGTETCRQDIQPVAEVCNDGLDNDCNGFTDSADPACQANCSDIRDRWECKYTPGCEWEGSWWRRGECVPTAPTSTCIDKDHDGYGSPGDPTCPNGGETDCNDNNSAIHPGADDSSCNGIDENCSGTADENFVSTPTSCGVGSCSATGQTQCQSGTEDDTCTPGTPGTEGPVGEPTCSDGADNDCDSFTDDNDSNCKVVAGCSAYTDRSSCKDDRSCSWNWRQRLCVEDKYYNYR